MTDLRVNNINIPEEVFLKIINDNYDLGEIKNQYLKTLEHGLNLLKHLMQ